MISYRVQTLTIFRYCCSLALFFLLSIPTTFLWISSADSADVTLSWDKPNDSRVTGYNIYAGKVGIDFKSTPIQTINSSDQLSCPIIGLEEGKIYAFAATSIDAEGNESGFSAEVYYNVPVLNVDSDGDGLTDEEEINIYGTDPNNADSDYDGINDGREVSYWQGNWDLDYDNDTLINLLDDDSDGDSILDGVEVADGSDPGDLNSVDSADVTLSWDKPNDSRVTGYNIYVGKVGTDFKSTPIQMINSSDQLSCPITGLERGEIYAFAATSIDADGNESGFSAEVYYNVPVLNVDSDGDGLTDEEEINIYGTDPNNADSDYDNDTLINLLDDDSDGDSFLDEVEVADGSDPGDLNSVPEPLSSDPILMEAEDGYIMPPMAIYQDSKASGGQYIEVPNGNGNSTDPFADSGYVEYDFDVQEPGNYLIWGRVLASNRQNDSFFVSVDNGEFIKWYLLRSKIWAWDVLNDQRDRPNPMIYSLDKGIHTLVIKLREDGTKLDRIVITSDLSLIPSE